MESEGKIIKAIIIIEVLGKPAEYIDQAIHDFIDRLGNEKDLRVINKKFYEPKPTESLFITFCEVEIEVNSLVKMMEVCFSYMPSSVEIIEPYELRLNLNDTNLILNALISRLHQYDAVAKKITFENNILQKQLQEIRAGRVLPQQTVQSPAKIQTKKPKKPGKKTVKSKKKS